MQDPVSYAQENIEQRRKRLIEIDRERVTVAAELRVFEDMLMKFSEAAAPVQGKPSKASASSVGAFQMSREWVLVFRALNTPHRQFDAADVIAVGQNLGFKLTVPSVRSQFAHYTKRKYLRKVSRGKYAITPLGREKFAAEAGEEDQGHLAPKENEALRVSPGASDASEARTSLNESQSSRGVFG